MADQERERWAMVLEDVADRKPTIYWPVFSKYLRRIAALLCSQDELQEAQKKLAHMIVYAQQLEAKLRLQNEPGEEETK